jgi:hypothetical protein
VRRAEGVLRIDFTVGKDDRRLARRIIRRLPTGGVRIGQPARLEDEEGRLIGWAIDHPALDEIDAIRLRHVMDTMAADDQAFTDPDLDDDGKITVEEIRALRQRIDAVPEVDAAIRAYRRSQRDPTP